MKPHRLEHHTSVPLRGTRHWAADQPLWGGHKRGDGNVSVAVAARARHSAPEIGAVTWAWGKSGMSHRLLCLTATAGPSCRAPFLTTSQSWTQTFLLRRTSLRQWQFPPILLFIPPLWNQKGCPVLAQHRQEQAGCRVPSAKGTRTIPAPESFHIQGCVSHHSVVP